MRKTERFQLSQWDLEDQIRMEDFNRDNLLIDSALASLGGGLEILVDSRGEDDGQSALTLPALSKLGGWENWSAVGWLVEIPEYNAYDESTDSFRFRLLDGARSAISAIQLPKPGTLLALFLPAKDAAHPASGLLLAENFLMPFRCGKNFADTAYIGVEYTSTVQRPLGSRHTYTLTRYTLFGVK